MIYQYNEYTTSHNFPPYIYMNIDIYSGWLYGTEEYIGTYLNHVEDISTWLACILRYLRIKLGPTVVQWRGVTMYFNFIDIKL